jgi:hypothetical protein
LVKFENAELFFTPVDELHVVQPAEWPLGGQTAIIVENEILIALDIRSILARLLPEKILMAGNLVQARELIEASGGSIWQFSTSCCPTASAFPLLGSC